MAQYSNLKAYIEEKIYENGTQAITGDILQDVLKVMTDDLGEFYQTGGVASPSTDPGTPDAKVIYFATEAGTYTNFGNIELAAGEVALLIFDTSWVKETLNVLSSANGGVKTANLADGAVTTAKIANGAVEEGKIADASVTSGKLGSGAVTTEKIADGAATTDKIANKAVATGKLGDKAVTTGKIADSAVGTTQVANEAITEGKIADEAVTAGKIADGAVTNGKINDGAVTEGKIGSGAVTTGKIGAKAVTTGKIADKAVTSGQLGDKAVTSDKIADGAVGSDQLAEGAFSAQNLADGSVTTDKLADDAVTAEKIADGAVTAGKFADGSVTTAKIGSSAITTEKIGDGMVTRRKIADAAVTTAKLDDEAVTTAKVADANVTTAKIADANVTTGKLADGAVTTAKIADGNVTGVKLQEGVRPVINVNALNEQSTAYGSAALARAAVPSALRILGLHVIYLLAGGWFEDEFIGSDVSGWGTASNWRAVGPVSVSQNIETGKTELLIGDTPALIVDNEPEAESDNLVKSGGVAYKFDSIHVIKHSFDSNSSAYSNYNYELKTGVKYEIKNQTSNACQFNDSNDDLEVYVAANTTIQVTPKVNCFGPKKVLGTGNVTVEPVDKLKDSAFVEGVLHSTNPTASLFIDELYVDDKLYDFDAVDVNVYEPAETITVRLYKNNVVIKSTSYDYTNYVNREIIHPDNGIYLIFNRPYVNSGTFDIINWQFNKNVRIATSILGNIDFNSLVTKKEGLNLISELRWGYVVISEGAIYNTHDDRYCATNKIYFGSNNYITCQSCALGSGLYIGIYNESGTLLQAIHPNAVTTTIQKIENAEYAIFTLDKGQGYPFYPMAQYGEDVTPYEQYSEIGGYLPQTTFYCGPDRQYKTLVSAIEAATSVMNATLYVDSGVYDLVQELGSDYFNSITSASDRAGIRLKNNIHIIFSPNALVKCHYTGDNEWVLKMFSPFNSDIYGFTLENLHLEGSRCRYLIHDDYVSMNAICQSNYINCNFKLDNTDNPYWGRTLIGGGMAVGTKINIEGCTFNCIGDNDDDTIAIFYHQVGNTSLTSFSSEIHIVNNYIENGTIVLSFEVENENNPTIVHICGNSVPYSTQINADGWKQNHTAFTYNKVYAWNNEIRTT